MRRYLFAIAAAALAAGGTMIGGRAEATPLGAPGAIQLAIDDLNLTHVVGIHEVHRFFRRAFLLAIQLGGDPTPNFFPDR